MERDERIELPKGFFNLLKKRRIQKRLTKKLNEYMQRCLQPETRRKYLDAWHKLHILSALLEYDFVEKIALKARMEVLPEFDLFLFNRAYNIIRAYVNEIPGIVLGGTGLPE